MAGVVAYRKPPDASPSFVSGHKYRASGSDRLLLDASPGEPDRRSDTLPHLLRAPELVGLTVIEG